MMVASWSMAAMGFLILPATLEDRSFARASAAQTARVAQKWGAWTARLGLRKDCRPKADQPSWPRTLPSNRQPIHWFQFPS